MKTMMIGAPSIRCAVSVAAAIVSSVVAMISGPMYPSRARLNGCCSISAMMRRMACTASRGYAPAAVSADSITASVPSMIAFATSLASARVGRGFSIIDSSICVAVMTGRPMMFADLMIFF